MQKPTTHQELLRLIDRAADEQWEELDLSGMGLEELPKSIGRLTQLKKLTLGEQLRGISTNKNCFAEIPKIIFSLEKLEKLNICENQIVEIPMEISCLQNLSTLDLSENQIVSLPDSISQLKNLAALNLTSNQIKTLPFEIWQLRNLVEFWIYNNQITEIPDSIGRLIHLRELHLGGNQISSVPNSLKNLIALEKLWLWGNQFAEIPEEIMQLTNLTGLWLNRNQITKIPESIAQLVNLTDLLLWSNRIIEIPPAISQLINLDELDLSRNQLSSIPEEILQMNRLKRLRLRSNRITGTLENIGKIEELNELIMLDLRENFLPISPEIIETGVRKPSVIFDYLHRLRSGKVRPLNEAKVLLVGQGSVGKTSLLNRLLHDAYNTNQSQTDGLAITKWNITVNTKPIRLNVWDFGGQEIYHATHQFFLTKRSLYLLVANCRTSEEENRLDYWLKLIETFGDSAPVIIIGNKSDEQPLDINRKALQEKYPNIKAILETSCATGQGIHELCDAIHGEIANLREVYDLLPESWFQVKQQLEQLEQTGTDFITISQYATLCATQGITSETDQTQLITLLHNLGLILNFRDHPILQTTQILNPNWVTNGIYQLLSDDRLKTITKGILTPTDLDRILHPDRYPKHRHHFLTELMQEFQLSFVLPDRSEREFLIPGILPKEEPATADLPNSGSDNDTLDFQYHYRILPDSIISRFIVLSHEKIHNQTYWRTGVLLEYCENHQPCNIAQIKSDPADSKIFIRISGHPQTRRPFLTLIRDTFQRIHKTFANLEIDEYIPVPDHPEADPLDYQELLGLEEMGETTVKVGKLKLRLDLRQLLNGYESIEQRQSRRMRESGDIHYHLYNGDLVQGDKSGNDMIRGDKIAGDKRINEI